MKKLEVNQMENLNGGVPGDIDCAMATIGTALAFVSITTVSCGLGAFLFVGGASLGIGGILSSCTK